MIDIQAAAEFLGVNVRYMRHLIHEKRITYYKVGRLIRFKQSDLEAFIEAGRQGVQ